jgi:hypothetical protein
VKTTNKAWLVLISFILVIVVIACSCGSISPSGGANPASPTILPSISETQAVTIPETPIAITPASENKAPAGTASVEQVSNQVNIPAGERGSTNAACPSGSLLLGGGFASLPGIKITKTMPDPSGWLVTGINNTGNALPLTSYAYCLHDTTGTVRVVSVNVPASGAPFARCEKGEIITGGGFADDTGSLDVYISTPIGDSVDPNNAWSVMARSSNNADQPLTVYAVCMSKSSLKSSLLRDDKVAYGSGNEALHFTFTCPSSSMMAAGGYEGTGVYISRINPAEAGLWEIQVQGKNYFDGSLDHAVCLGMP